jgi:hypothetical protein
MFNQDTRDIFNSLTNITDKFYVQNETLFIDEYVQIMGRVYLTEDIQPFGIYNMNEFLNVIKIVQEPEISIENGIIGIKNENTEVSYLTSDKSILPKTDEKIIEGVRDAETVLEFVLTADYLDGIRKAYQIFSDLDSIEIRCSQNPNKLELSLGSKTRFNAITNTYKLSIPESEYKCYKDLSGAEIFLPVENLLKLPKVDYDLQVKFNSSNNRYRVYMKNTGGLLFEFVLTLKN